MMSKNLIEAKDYRNMLSGAISYLAANAESVNALNVFPVPDGDTGSNMLSTLGGANAAEYSKGVSLGDYSQKVSYEMMRASRGNSGVILSLFFRGVAKALCGNENADTALLLSAFKNGAHSAQTAVAEPVEGTVLTVMRECCEIEIESEDIVELFDKITEKAEAVLATTTEMLPALRRARVVDSGGKGFVIILSGMKDALSGKITAQQATQTPKNKTFTANEEIKYTYCTECLAKRGENTASEAIQNTRKELEGFGDSIVFVQDGEIIKLHIHTNEPLTVLSMIFKLGDVEKSKIENMKIQHSNFTGGTTAQRKKKYALCAICDADGIADLFCELNVTEIIRGGDGINPSTNDIIEIAKKSNAETVFILTNNKNCILAANQAAKMCRDFEIRVIPSLTLPQGISAAMAFNPARGADENFDLMCDAMGDVISLSVTRAQKDAETEFVKVRKKDYLGLCEGKIRVSNPDLFSAVKELIKNHADGDFFTVFFGRGVSDDELKKIAEIIKEIKKDADINCISGGQKTYRYIISAE